MIKKIWEKIREPLKTFFFLGIAAWLAAYLTSAYKNYLDSFADLLSVNRTYLTDPKFILPFLTPVVYMIVQVILGLLPDKKSTFVGLYLSLPAKHDELNIFKITFDSLGGYYKVTGYAYSLLNGKVIGYWESQKLDMKTTEPVALRYIYEVEIYEGNRKGKVGGHVDIKFEGEKPHKSQHGYWVDVNDIGTTAWTRSNYVRLTPRIRKKIFANWIFLDNIFPFVRIRRWINKPRSIFDAYYAQKDELNSDVEFSRPPSVQ